MTTRAPAVLKIGQPVQIIADMYVFPTMVFILVQLSKETRGVNEKEENPEENEVSREHRETEHCPPSITRLGKAQSS